MRNEINTKPHQVMWLGLAVIFIFAYVFPCETVRIHFFDNAREIPPFSFASGFILYLGFLGIIYWRTISAGKKLINGMTLFHLAYSLFFCITLIFAGCEEGLSDESFRLTVAILIFILAQIAFVFNIAQAFLKK